MHIPKLSPLLLALAACGSSASDEPAAATGPARLAGTISGAGELSAAVEVLVLADGDRGPGWREAQRLEDLGFGPFAIAPLEAGTYRVEVRVTRPRGESPEGGIDLRIGTAVVELSAGATHDLGTFALDGEPGHTLEVHFQDADGNAIAPSALRGTTGRATPVAMGLRSMEPDLAPEAAFQATIEVVPGTLNGLFGLPEHSVDIGLWPRTLAEVAPALAGEFNPATTHSKVDLAEVRSITLRPVVHLAEAVPLRVTLETDLETSPIERTCLLMPQLVTPARRQTTIDPSARAVVPTFAGNVVAGRWAIYAWADADDGEGGVGAFTEMDVTSKTLEVQLQGEPFQTAEFRFPGAEIGRVAGTHAQLQLLRTGETRWAGPVVDEAPVSADGVVEFTRVLPGVEYVVGPGDHIFGIR